MIWFDSERARKQLIDTGLVVTCRTRRNRFGNDIAVYHTKNGERNARETIGNVHIRLVKETVRVRKLDQGYDTHVKGLEQYLHLSGFDTVYDWKNEIFKLIHRNLMPNRLIFLEVTLL